MLSILTRAWTRRDCQSPCPEQPGRSSATWSNADHQAMHIQPSDRAILYNIAMIQQKAAEMLLSLEPAKRTSEELQAAVLQAQHAAKWVFDLVHSCRQLGRLPSDVS